MARRPVPDLLERGHLPSPFCSCRNIQCSFSIQGEGVHPNSAIHACSMDRDLCADLSPALQNFNVRNPVVTLQPALAGAASGRIGGALNPRQRRDGFIRRSRGRKQAESDRKQPVRLRHVVPRALVEPCWKISRENFQRIIEGKCGGQAAHSIVTSGVFLPLPLCLPLRPETRANHEFHPNSNGSRDVPASATWIAV